MKMTTTTTTMKSTIIIWYFMVMMAQGGHPQQLFIWNNNSIRSMPTSLSTIVCLSSSMIPKYATNGFSSMFHRQPITSSNNSNKETGRTNHYRALSTSSLLLLWNSRRNSDRFNRNEDDPSSPQLPPSAPVATRRTGENAPLMMTTSRRAWLQSRTTVLPLLLITSTTTRNDSSVANAASTNGIQQRDDDYGRGKIVGDNNNDVRYPKALFGSIYDETNNAPQKWEIRRVVTRIEGEYDQADLTWRALGGAGGFGAGTDDDDATNENDAKIRMIRKGWEEVYETTFLPSPPFTTRYDASGPSGNNDGGDDVVIDRGFELKSRLLARNEGNTLGAMVDVRWDRLHPNTIRYEVGKRAIGGVELTILERTTKTTTTTERKMTKRNKQRRVFEISEMVRVRSDRDGSKRSSSSSITPSSTNNKSGSSKGGSGLVAVVPFQPRIARITTRYQIPTDNDDTNSKQSRTSIEGIEVIETYRVVCGVALLEKGPTSTTTSRIQLRRRSTSVERKIVD